MKRILFGVIFACFTFLSSFGQVNAEEGEYTYGDYKYQYWDDEIVLTKYTGNEKEVYVPATIDGMPVKYLEGTFDYNEKIEKVHLPNTIIEINAFVNCVNLQQVNIPESVISLRGFAGCIKLKEIQIPYGVRRIDGDAFRECISLEQIEIPDSVNFMGEDVFGGCSNLKRIKLSNQLEEIGGNCFYDCKKLESIHIPDDVKYIGAGAFIRCTSLKTVKLPKSLRYIGANAFYKANIQEITIPSKVTNIGKYAFEDCKKLKKVVIKSKRITRIKKDCFKGIHKKAVIDVPNSCRAKYKKMLKKANKWKNTSIKIK